MTTNYKELLVISLLFATALGQKLDENLAINKPARQIGTYDEETADKAVDNQPEATCSTADSNDDNLPAWWQVDLGELCNINSVVISAPQYNDYQYLQTLIVLVGNDNSTDDGSVCHIFYNASMLQPGVKLTLACRKSLIGRYVTISRTSGYYMRALTMCDVSVLGTTYQQTTQTMSSSTIITNSSKSTTFSTSTPKGSATTARNFLTPTTAKYETNTVSITNAALAGIITGSVVGVFLLLVAAIMLTLCVVRQR
jgi:hypothetical protein